MHMLRNRVFPLNSCTLFELVSYHYTPFIANSVQISRFTMSPSFFTHWLVMGQILYFKFDELVGPESLNISNLISQCKDPQKNPTSTMECQPRVLLPLLMSL